ncbi:MAG: single-stranded DNA-binding protein, partial [Bacteroidetes bacterium QH_8_67_23]
TWEDRDGNTRYSTEIKMRNMMMLGGEEGGRGGGRGSRDGMDQQRPERTGEYDQRQQQPQRQGAGGGGGQQSGGGEDDTFEPDDELPF